MKTIQDLIDVLKDYPVSFSNMAMGWTMDDVKHIIHELETIKPCKCPDPSYRMVKYE